MPGALPIRRRPVRPAHGAAGRADVSARLPLSQRLEILGATTARIWQRAPDCGLPTGTEKARWLADFIVKSWDELS